jgi:hypothetical protein
MDKHITALGILYIVLFGFGLLTALLIFTILSGTGVLSGNPEAGAVLTTVGTIIAVYLIIVSLPSLIVGIGILKRYGWGRIAGLVVAALNILNFPFGTALAIYTFWVLLTPEVKRFFTEAGSPG